MSDWNWKLELKRSGYTALGQLDWNKKRQTYWYAQARWLNALKAHCELERWKQEQPYRGFRTFRQYIRWRDNHICYLCDGYILPDDSDLEHDLPVIRGGKTDENNCHDSHHRCNMAKGRKTAAEYWASLNYK